MGLTTAKVVPGDATHLGSIGQMIKPIISDVLRTWRNGEDDLADFSVRAENSAHHDAAAHGQAGADRAAAPRGG